MKQDMKMTLTRIFTMALLMMVSIGSWAQIKVDIENDGKFNGGTIVEPKNSQVKSDDGTKVTVTLTVTPASGYTITKKDITVVATLASSPARRNAPEISGTLDLDGQDPADLSKPRNYTVTVDANLGVWVQDAKFKLNGAKGTTPSGKTDYSGLYYFANGGSGKTNPNDPAIKNITNPSDYFYLVPADNPQQSNKRDAWYSSSDTNGDSDQPYLTTYKTNKDAAVIPAGVTNRPHNSVWIVKFVSTDSGTDYYHIIHAATGKYVVYEPPFPDNKNNRKSVHLLTTDNPGENAKFAITPHQITISSIKYDCYNFRPKSIGTGSDINKYLNTSNRNFNYYYSHSSTNDGNVVDYYEGLIGLWKDAGGASDWKPEEALLDAPTISDVDEYSIATVTDANGIPNGYNIRYTTDNTDPTASSPILEGGSLTVTSSLTLKAVVERYGIVLTEVASKALEPAPCAIPVITYDYTTSKVSITCLTVGSSIYYTISGSDPTASSTEYNEPFSVSSPTTVKAIATHATFATSSVAELAISQVATPTIQNNGSNAISIITTTPDATIYYTTDGSDPTTSSTLYEGPLTENVSNVTIKAIAVKENMITSTVGSGTVKLQCATPVITRDGMTFTLSCSFPTDANLYYTLDGGSEVAYTGTPVSFTSDQLPMIVTAVARHSNYTQSETASMELLNGTGTSDDPYLIYGATDFTNFISNVNAGATASAYYKLETDVSASGAGAISTEFTGTFDGGMHTISGLGHALFNTVNGGVVKNVILDNISISGGENVGAICNEATGASRIYNCGVLATNSTTTTDENGYTTITSCSSSISGGGYVGGIVGLLDGSSRVINCFSYANVSGGSEVGGIVGHNNVATTASNLQTMVMNCMFYGEISGTSIAPIYNGSIITNDGDANGVNNFNYFRLESSYIQNTEITKVYNCALGAETRFLQRFEFYRHLLNSNRELAAWWASKSTTTVTKEEMMKWVLEPTQIGTNTPYPILKYPDKYASVVNYTPSTTAYDNTEANRNKGRKLTSEGDGGVLHVTIDMGTNGGSGAKFSAPSGARLKDGETGKFDLTITDKDFEHFNFNYAKVQLPYYNDYCVGNYTGNRVVTGWKITSITGGTAGTYSTGDDVTYTDGVLTATPYNFADRKCTNKDLYSKSGRVFNQGAYWDVPEGVTAITIQPYWGKAVYLADAYWDVVYKNGSGGGTGAGTAYDAMTTAADVPNVGGDEGIRYKNGVSTFNEQLVYTSMSNAIASTALFSETGGDVNDYAVVLVGNYHQIGSIEANKNYTVTSVDLDGDNEPDYSFILRFNGRLAFHPVKYDFLNLIGLGMAQKSTGGKGSYNLGIMQPKAWFEVTNTALFRVTQFEYSKGRTKSPYILQGGVIEQWVTQQDNAGDGVSYFHIGGNVWFKEFHRGSHQDNAKKSTPHPPLSVTGGDFDKFYLTGYYQSQATIYDDNAECYINGGRFGEVAGAGMEGIGTSNDKGNITWIIDNADIKEFYGGGINYANPVHGNIHTIISNSHVDVFCGGPKFGDMESGRTVTTTATNCTFGTYFGAGYGGNSYNRVAPRNHNNMVNFPHSETQAGSADSWDNWLGKNYKQNVDNGGVSTQFDYQFLPMSSNTENVARIFVDYVAFSLATTHDVTSSLTGCTITGNFYGGGSLGKVTGDVTSTLTGCTVNGSVFGAGYSASLPTVEVMDIGFQTEPYYYEDLGTYRKGVFPATTTYTWEHANAISVDNQKHILYTTADLTNLGSVSGTATLTINGTTTVAESVYGGGEESGVGGEESTDVGNTVVIINSGTIGTSGSGGATYGNVYGGGKGKYKEKRIVDGVEKEVVLDPDKAVILGLVKGSTNVTINGGDILHNVYGGGAYGSVGTYTYDSSGNITGYTSGGTANVTIKGGTIGTTGKDNGMVFGSSRGDVDATDAIQDRLAWVHDTHVVIGTSGQGSTLTTPLIKGSVYGSGENGHTYENTIVDIHSGTIGITETSIDGGAAYAYRGNVYGGGCGTDMYKYDSDNDGDIDDDDAEAYNPLAGIVYGTTTVNIDGGQVVRNVYGAGAMGSVGTADNATSSGLTTINISGGTIGVSGTVGDGNVFGAARGAVDATSNEYALVRNYTTVNISGSNTMVYGSVYGGGELGCVGTYSISSDMKNFYWTDTPIADIDPENPDTYPYNSTGVCNVNITGGTIGTGVSMSQDGTFANGNVYGAGKGDDDTYWCEKAMVYKTNVTINGGTINGTVYGGGQIGRVENDATVTIGVASPINDTPALTIAGNVFGAGAGLGTHGYSALLRGDAKVTVQGNAHIGLNVYGGGEKASVGRFKIVGGLPSEPANDGSGDCYVNVQGNAVIGTNTDNNITDKGNVFGTCQGVTPPTTSEFTAYNKKYTSMQAVAQKQPQGTEHTAWDWVEGSENIYYWEYYPTLDAYKGFLNTLALASHPVVTIGGTLSNETTGAVTPSGNPTVNGSVYGGGQRGITLGTVAVNIVGGTVNQDVYGGGALADTNKGNQTAERYDVATVTPDVTVVTGMYERTGDGTTTPYQYTLIETANITAESGHTYCTLAPQSSINTTTVNLTGGTIIGDAYGGGLGQIERAASEGVTALDDIKAYVWGDVTVKLNEAKTATDKGCSVSRIFGCNNQNGTPKGKVKVYVSATQNKTKEKIGTDKDDANLHTGAEVLAEGESSTYDVAAVYGGGNLSPYEPYDDNERTEVYIDGCKLTSIKQVYGGGNAACAPATLVRVTGAYEIEELFGGGNGYDDYELYGKTYLNPGANVGYRNYTHPVWNDELNKFEAVDNEGTSTLEGRRSYAYGSGIATTEIIGGKIHFVYGGSNKKGNIRTTCKSTYEELDETCPIVTDETYGGGKDSPMDGMVDMGLGCVNNMEQTFGGSKNADVNSDIVLRITNGTYKQVFGGNNTSGAINGSITVEIKEEGCSPVRIEELYLGGYLAPYSVYGYETENGEYKKVEYKDENGNNLYDDKGNKIMQPIPLTSPASGSTPKKDPRIYVISASRIDNIFGGGYKATVVGNPHVNVNMERGKIDKKYNTAENPVTTGLHEDTNSPKRPYYDYTVETSEPGNDAILAIGTIGNIYGGGNEADIIGNTHVEIGTGYWHNENDVLETIATDGHTYTYNETTKKWSYEETIGEGESQSTQTGTSDKAPVPARNAATITGNVFGGGKGKADTYECEKAMVGVADGQDSSIGNTSVIIGNGTVKRTFDADGKVIGGNVYGGGEVGRVEFNTAVTIGLDPDEVTATSAPTIEGDVFGAGAGVETHGYSALVRGNASVTVQSNAQINGSVYGGGEKATVGKYWVKGVNYPSSLNPPQAPSDDVLPDFMPYAPRSGGICTVIVKDNAKIGDETTGGHVFGAGKGVEPHWVYDDNTIEKKYWSRRMSKYDSRDYNTTNQELWVFIKEYTQEEINDNTITKCVWEYFDTEAKYATFLETLALASETQVTIGETSGNEVVTVNGSVYGGSENGFVQTDTDVEIQSTSTIGANVFGGGKGTETHDAAGRVKGNTLLNISGGSIAGNVYGGGELGHVGTFTETADGRYVMQTIKDKNGSDMNTGLCTVTITGGTIGSNTDTEKGNVFGAGKGKDDTFKCEKAMAMNTNVSISAGTVNGNVYGGGEIGRVENDTEVKIGSGDGTGGSTSSPTINGSVFGAGRGVATHGYSALVRKDTKVTVEGDAHVGHSVYGGGEIASVGRYGLDADKMPSILLGLTGYCTVKVQGHATIGPENASDDKGNVFGAGQGIDPQTFNKDAEDHSKRSRRMTVYNATDFPDNAQLSATGTTTNGTKWEYIKEYTQAEINNNTITKFVWEYYLTKDKYTTYLETLALATHPEVTIDGNVTVNGSVYGGGEQGITKGSVVVNIKDGTIEKDVYGGGALANTNTTSSIGKLNTDGSAVTVNGVIQLDEDIHPTTTVTLSGGVIGNNVYGGGLGRLEKEGVTAVEAKVYGDVLVTLNGTKTVTTTGEGENTTTTYSYNDNCVVKGSIFGCNNLNGSPQKAVTVHVYKTQGWEGHTGTMPDKLDSETDADHSYHLTAVYGGGNLAPFMPDLKVTCDTVQARVIIDGCDLTSIKQVYGGGNAASAPATNVTVNSAYEIEEVFGGGNGYDDYELYGKTYQNPGANVGYKNYTTFEWNGNKNLYEVVVNEDADTKEERLSSAYVYGTGEASVNIYGGRIHRIFGGSNTLGNVRKTAVTVLDSQDPCLLDIDEAYGGGKSASMDAEAKLIMACIPGLKAVYGGAQDADIQDDVVLTITNGTFNRVFGGNNVSGSIHGTITVNIEETGCKPVIIGQLYGGGNQAPYTAPWKDENDHSKGRKEGPTVNVKSFTSIGEVFGGGYGETAVVTGDPYVNINVCEGKFAGTAFEENTQTFSFSEYKRNKDGEGENSFEHNIETGERIVETKTVSVLLPGHEANKTGAINNIFGGGNAAPVVGNPNVNIGTRIGEDEYMAVVEVAATVTETDGYYTRSGEGTATSPYEYTPFTGTPSAGKTYYKKYTIKGADIRGNVYGGGNNAEVTGNTNVQIGKKAE